MDMHASASKVVMAHYVVRASRRLKLCVQHACTCMLCTAAQWWWGGISLDLSLVRETKHAEGLAETVVLTRTLLRGQGAALEGREGRGGIGELERGGN